MLMSLLTQGRWASISAARNYLDDAQASLVRLRTPEISRRDVSFLRGVYRDLFAEHNLSEGGVESLLLDDA